MAAARKIRVVTLPLLPPNDPAEVPARDAFAEVAVNRRPAGAPAVHLQASRGPHVVPRPGRVRAFGPRILQGIVMAVSAETHAWKPCGTIAAIARPEPILREAHLALRRWMSQEIPGSSHLGRVASCLPSATARRRSRLVSLPWTYLPPVAGLSKDQRILRFIAETWQGSPFDALRRSLGSVSFTHAGAAAGRWPPDRRQGLARNTGDPGSNAGSRFRGNRSMRSSTRSSWRRSARTRSPRACSPTWRRTWTAHSPRSASSARRLRTWQSWNREDG